MKRFFTRLLLVVALPIVAVQASDIITIGPFSQSGLEGWEAHEFVGQTRYRLVQVDGKSVLRADSQQAASALIYRQRIDLRETPILTWSWRKTTAIDPGDETLKSGDDFVARLYVIREGGLLFWNTRALNYVWSYQHSSGDVWDNPFVGFRSKMMSVRDMHPCG